MMEKERRKFKRFEAFLGIKYKNEGEEPRKGRGISLSRDLSREGMKIQLTEKIPKGTVFDLEIDIPDDPKPVHTSAEVVWSKQGKSDEAQGYEIGVRFLMMDPVDKFRVLDYAYNHWLETKVNDFSDPEKISELA